MSQFNTPEWQRQAADRVAAFLPKWDVPRKTPSVVKSKYQRTHIEAAAHQAGFVATIISRSRGDFGFTWPDVPQLVMGGWSPLFLPAELTPEERLSIEFPFPQSITYWSSLTPKEFKSRLQHLGEEAHSRLVQHEGFLKLRSRELEEKEREREREWVRDLGEPSGSGDYSECAVCGEDLTGEYGNCWECGSPSRQTPQLRGVTLRAQILGCSAADLNKVLHGGAVTLPDGRVFH